MASEAPPFWWLRPDWRAYGLWPVSRLYGAVARHRLEHGRRAPIDLPVLCVGNFTVGGAGKTPVAIALAREAQGMGLKPGFLSRGHGGAVSGAHLVNLHHDGARFVGDEPLLLAEHAPVAVARDRLAGARLLLGEGCDFVIMDDGFQSARLIIDHALIVVDADRGIGNGFTIPAGPMRAGLVDQLRHASALLKVGDGEAADDIVRRAARAGRPIHRAELRPAPLEALRGRRCLAFAGIGHPAKFFRTVRDLGGTVELARSFGDHHHYADDEARELLDRAARDDLLIVTTTKDAARLRHGTKVQAELLEKALIVEVAIVFDTPAAARTIIEETLKAWRLRRLDGQSAI